MSKDRPAFDPDTGEQLGLADGQRPAGLEDLTDFDLAWPTATDTLTPSAAATGPRASIDSSPSGDFRRADGYRRAALVLADELSHGLRDEETLVYPFVYCWRHHLELMLKMLIKDSAELYGRPLPENLSKTHSLASLWASVKPYIRESFPDDPTADTTIPDRVVGQFANIDPHGMTLRYAHTPEGKPTGATPRRVEIMQFSQALLNFSKYIEGAIEGTYYLTDARPDW